MSRGLDVIQRKLARAGRELDQLEAELLAYDETAGFGAEMVGDFDQLIFRVRQLPDPEWEVTIGSVAHHLRSTLDQLVTHIVVAAGGSADEHRGQFPITTSVREYHRSRKDGSSYRDTALAGVPEEARRIIDGLQPFGDDRHPLALLQHISNWDKHHDGQPAITVAQTSEVYLTSDEAQTTYLFVHDAFRPHALGPGDDLLASCPTRAASSGASSRSCERGRRTQNPGWSTGFSALRSGGVRSSSPSSDSSSSSSSSRLCPRSRHSSLTENSLGFSWRARCSARRCDPPATFSSA